MKKKWLIALIAGLGAVLTVVAPPLAPVVSPLGALILGLPVDAPSPVAS